MTSLPRFERNLPGILEDLYVGPSPDYRDDLLAVARRTRQRPAWSFPERWIPMDTANRLAFAPRYPVRLLAVGLLILALVAAGLIWYAGTHPAIKPAVPFGPAGNGAIVYALGGDIYVGDPGSGTSHRISTSAEFDRNPFVSPDGTHVAFLRTAADSTADSFDLVVADIDGSNARTISTSKVSDGDPAVWSPDSTFLLMMNSGENLYRYNVDGSAPVLVARRAMARAFLPPDGRQLVYEELDPAQRSLGIMNADGTDRHIIYTIPTEDWQDGCDYGSVLVSPGGKSIAFERKPHGTGAQCRVFLMNLDGTGAHQLAADTDYLYETDLQFSPDGATIAFNRWNSSKVAGQWLVEPIGVVSVNGGATRSIGPTPVGDGAAFQWSPDGKSIVSTPATVVQWPPSKTMPEAHPVIIDVATGAWHEAPWTMSSWPTWQRVGR